ncbi:MAG: DUF3667 domain-containing protein [Woeseiaceae bacterium]
MTEDTNLEVVVCPACGASISAHYCAECGERRFDRSRHTVGHFITELTRFVTELDSRFLRSFALLLARPGFLTRERIAGRSKKYLSPFALFAIANLAFFFAQPLANINTFNSTLKMQQRDYLHTPIVRAQVEQHVAAGSVDESAFHDRYDDVSEDIAKSLIILQVPIFALLLTLIRARSESLLFDHLVWSTHFYAFQLLLNTVITVGVFVYFKFGGNDFSLALPALAATFAYIFVALRVAFGDRYWVVTLRSIALVVAFGLVIEFYRFLLFLITFTVVT